jgi:hypothetical protein
VSDEAPFDSGDRKAVTASIKSAKAKDERLRESLRGIMSSPGGREWVHSLLLRCRPFRTPFSADALLTAFSCGQQDIGLQLLGELDACSPELYLAMMKENK